VLGGTRFAMIVYSHTKMIIRHLIDEYGYDELAAITVWYSSKTYELFAVEHNMIWYYSHHILFEFLKDELDTGVIKFPWGEVKC